MADAFFLSLPDDGFLSFEGVAGSVVVMGGPLGPVFSEDMGFTIPGPVCIRLLSQCQEVPCPRVEVISHSAYFSKDVRPLLKSVQVRVNFAPWYGFARRAVVVAGCEGARQTMRFRLEEQEGRFVWGVEPNDILVGYLRMKTVESESEVQ